MLHKNISEIAFRQSNMQPILKDLSISKADEAELKNIFNYMQAMYTYAFEHTSKKTANKFKRDVHIVSMTPYVHLSINKNVKVKDFTEKMIEFYSPDDKTSISEDYNFACASAANSNAAIVARDNALKKHLKSLVS